jgi:hypothetical protein
LAFFYLFSESTNFLFLIFLISSIINLHLGFLGYFKGVKSNLMKFFRRFVWNFKSILCIFNSFLFRLKYYTVIISLLLSFGYFWYFIKQDAFYIDILYSTFGIIFLLSFVNFKKLCEPVLKEKPRFEDDFQHSLRSFEMKFWNKNGTRVWIKKIKLKDRNPIVP